MPSRIEQLCKDKGLKMTGQRRVIAQVLSAAEDHPDAEELHKRAASIDDRISLATVYRTVRLFEEAQILERHDFRDGRARFETAEDGDGHHHHIINVRSGEVVHVGEIESLRRGRLDVDRVGKNTECGVSIVGWGECLVGDEVRCIEVG